MKKDSKNIDTDTAFMLEMWKSGIEVSNLDAIKSSLRKTMRDIIKKHSPEKAKKWYYDLQLCRAGIIKEEDVEKID